MYDDHRNDESAFVISKKATVLNKDPSVLRLLQHESLNKVQQPFEGYKNSSYQTLNGNTFPFKNSDCEYIKFDNNQNKLNDLNNIVNVLEKASKETRMRWSKELICKLHLIQANFSDGNYNITLKCLKVDSSNNLVIDLVEPHLVRENNSSYKTPEQFFCEHSENCKTNIWAAGICIYYLNTMTFPWKRASLNDENFRRWVGKKEFKHELDKVIFDILKLLLTVDSNQRPVITEVVKKAYEERPRLKIISELVLKLH